MNFRENVREGLRSVQANLLRSALTALIVAIGITSLVGILTAVDSMQASVDNSFADLGANAFDIEVPSAQRRYRRGREGKSYPAIDYRQAKDYEEMLPYGAKVSLSTYLTGIAEAKYGGRTTNPNSSILGANEHFLASSGLDLDLGRNFSSLEISQGSYVCILGKDVADYLFDKENPIGADIALRGNRYRVIGVLKKAGGSFGGSGKDRYIIIPLENARLLAGDNAPTYDIKTILNPGTNFDMAIGEATSLMRRIRKDPVGQENSFEIARSETLADRLENITGYLKMGGGIVGFITLLGAAIGLMNIMMVSVTERTREIGVRKALGATPFRIRQQFLIEAVVICQIGGLLGVLLGIAVGNLVAQLLNVGTFIIPWFWILLALLVCVLVGILSGFYPAYKASQLDPIESLRFE